VVEAGVLAMPAKANIEQLHRPSREGLDAGDAALPQLQQLCLLLQRARDGYGRPAATGCPERTGLGIHSLIVKMKGLLIMC
jgi:hypothetical protein